MNQQKSLINLLLLSTAALSGYKKGAATQYKTNHHYRSENPTPPTYTNPQAYNNTYNATNNTNYNSPPSTNSNTTNNQDTTYTNTTPYTPNNTLNSMPNNNSTQTYNATTTSTSMPNTNMSTGSSATNLANSDTTFLPALLAALYAADEAVGINSDATGPFSLNPLEFDYNDLDPYISEDTLRIHHQTLHQNYVTNLNTALSRYPEFYAYTMPELLLFPDRLPSDIQNQVVHNAGGNYNHSLIWKLMGPNTSSRPTGEFAKAINQQFGSFENLKTILNEAGRSVQGTGYAWLTLNPYGRLIVVTTEEQLTPIPLRTVPILPIDVWEHAYFLDYEENRGEHIDNLYNVIDWDRVGQRYLAALDVFNNMNDLT